MATKTRQATILVVDSDDAAARVTRYGLLRLLEGDATVLLASSAQAWAACRAGEVSILIVDPSPSSRGGVELLRRVRQEYPGIGVLVLTSYDTPRVRREMWDLGVRHYLAKPVDMPALADEVRAMMDTRDGLRLSNG